MRFELRAFRFRFRAEGEVRFPAGKAGNTIRGALGLTSLRDHPSFVPAGRGAGPSGFADPPRPFVLRAWRLDGMTFRQGQEFHVDLHLFDLRPSTLEAFRAAMNEMARAGLGLARGVATLESVDPLGDSEGVIALPLEPLEQTVRRVRVRFVTPTEIKSGGRLVDARCFPALASRIRDRLSTLGNLFGAGPLKVDYREFARLAEQVRCVRRAIRWKSLSRRSSRTGQRHPIGGFTGEVEYEGELSRFLPYLRAAYWTGVGRHTVWGNGVIETEVRYDDSPREWNT
jgi:hypothetical protein